MTVKWNQKKCCLFKTLCYGVVFVGVFGFSSAVFALGGGWFKCSFNIVQTNQQPETPFEVPRCWGQAEKNGVNRGLEAAERHFVQLDHRVTEVSQQQFVFWNHYLNSMQCALQGNPSKDQEDTVDQLYDAWGSIPGHHPRHHRDFRNVLVGRFRECDHKITHEAERLNQLNAKHEQLQGECVQLRDANTHMQLQMQQILQRLQLMENKNAVIEQENKELKAELSAIKTEQSQRGRSASPCGRR